MYVLIRMKSLIRSIRFWIPVFLGIVFGLCLHLIANSSVQDIQYEIAVIDEDRTEASQRLVDEIKKINGIKTKSVTGEHHAKDLISQGNYYLVYTIKKGYMEQLKSANIKDLIDVDSFSINTSVKWLNDKVAAIIIREYVYYDMFLRIKKEQNRSFSDYEEEVRNTKKQSEILRLNVINESQKSNASGVSTNLLRRNNYAVLLFLVGIGVYTGLKAFQNVCEMRQSGLSLRLRKAGIKEASLFLSELFIVITTVFAVIGTFILIGSGVGLTVYAMSLAVSLIGSLMFWGLSGISGTTATYLLLSWTVLILLLIGSCFVMYLKF